MDSNEVFPSFYDIKMIKPSKFFGCNDHTKVTLISALVRQVKMVHFPLKLSIGRLDADSIALYKFHTLYHFNTYMFFSKVLTLALFAALVSELCSHLCRSVLRSRLFLKLLIEWCVLANIEVSRLVLLLTLKFFFEIHIHASTEDSLALLAIKTRELEMRFALNFLNVFWVLWCFSNSILFHICFWLVFFCRDFSFLPSFNIFYSRFAFFCRSGSCCFFFIVFAILRITSSEQLNIQSLQSSV